MTQDNIRALDQLRQRINLLYTSIQSLRESLERSDPLPTWPAIQSTAAAVSYNLQQLNETMQANRTLLREAHAYPLPTFPGLSQGALAETLLRKKLEPGAEDWVDQYTTKSLDHASNGAIDDALSRDELEDLWSWAKSASTSIVRPMYEEGGAFEDNFTIAEREAGIENIVTGLRMKLDGQESDEDDDSDEKMEDIMPSNAAATAMQDEAGTDSTLPAIPLDNIMKFTTTGALPGSATNPLPREIASKLGKG